MKYLNTTVLLLSLVLIGYNIVQAQDIHKAVSEGNIENVIKALNNNKELINQVDNMMNTPLHIAAQNGHNDILKYLVENGADITARNPYNRLMPLHFAIFGGNIEGVRYLIDNGADFNEPAYEGNSCLHLAASQGKKDIIDLLIIKGMNISIKTYDGNTLLHSASADGQNEIIKWLISKGAYINVKNVFGKTPLHFAASSGYKESIKLLLEKGADITITSLDGRTPVHTARDCGQKDAAELLISEGAENNPRQFPELTGDYLGQNPPGLTPEIFAPGIISTDAINFALTMTPDSREIYYTQYRGEMRIPFNTIYVTKISNGIWTEPEQAVFSGKHLDFEPHITPDGKIMYFGSDRPIGEDSLPVNRIPEWYVERIGSGWSEPKLLGPPFSDVFVMYPTVSRNHSFYFTGEGGIFVSKWKNGKYKIPVNMGDNINFLQNPAHSFIAPNESYLIYDGQSIVNGNPKTDLYISFKGKDGSWTKGKKMGDSINKGADAAIPYVSPDGKYFFFSRNNSIYWVDAIIINNMKSNGSK